MSLSYVDVPNNSCVCDIAWKVEERYMVGFLCDLETSSPGDRFYVPME